jgi:hypothetical protein
MGGRDRSRSNLASTSRADNESVISGFYDAEMTPLDQAASRVSSSAMTVSRFRKQTIDFSRATMPRQKARWASGMISGAGCRSSELDGHHVRDLLDEQTDQLTGDVSHDDGGALGWLGHLHAEAAGHVDHGNDGAAQVDEAEHIRAAYEASA